MQHIDSFTIENAIKMGFDPKKIKIEGRWERPWGTY